MSRYVHPGNYVYDDASDQWTRHDSPELARTYAAEEDPFEMLEVDVASASAISTRVLVVSQGGGVVAQTPAMMLAPMNPARRRLLVSANPTQTSDQGIGVILGARAEIMAGTGYYLTQGSRVTLETTAEVWVSWPLPPMGPASGQTNTCVVTALSESEQ